ncbi:hypothetical protein [Neorhizobium sp. AL 9.2.2]|uniref:hypothetical protein n=1 Tax=Neorhizobium sp. AL 9.2.2 TaxID=2712894 RepID=UPI00157348E6|nr:hypothetical protein [Neorhizobium sp. AL 9.2.2]NSY17714.1 hypothetical protein [Neorhizobium sp. AL 9.2.2]
MDQQLTQTIADYCAGQEDYSGTAAIDLMIARLRNENRFNEISEALQRYVKSKPMQESREWSAINLIVEKLNLQDSKLAREIELTLDRSFPPEVFDRFHQLRAFQAAGGSVTPKVLKGEYRLRDELPAFWLDLAIDAYKGDEIGFVDAASGLIHSTTVTWKDIRKRIIKIVAALGTGAGVSGLAAISKAFADHGDRNGFLQAVNERLGTHLSADAEGGAVKAKSHSGSAGRTVSKKSELQQRVVASLTKRKVWYSQLNDTVAA